MRTKMVLHDSLLCERAHTPWTAELALLIMRGPRVTRQVVNASVRLLTNFTRVACTVFMLCTMTLEITSTDKVYLTYIASQTSCSISLGGDSVGSVSSGDGYGVSSFSCLPV